jgi:transposase-like protein
MPNGKPRDPQKERFWRQAIRRWLKSGLSAQAFCLENGLSPASFYAWQRTLAQRDAQAIPFAQVHVLADEASNSLTPAVGAAFELVLANRRVLRIGTHFDAATLRRLLPLLEEDPPC